MSIRQFWAKLNLNIGNTLLYYIISNMKVSNLYKPASILLLIISSFLLLIYKLDYEYFFTDEVVYVQTGQNLLVGDYTQSREVPMLGKYIVGLTATFAHRNIFLLRLPFVFMAVASVFIVFLILKERYGHYWGILGGFLYIFSPFTYSTSRMAMLEPLNNLLWLCFHFFYLRFFMYKKIRYMLFAGVFIGLGMATKIPSIVLYPFSLLIFLMYLKAKKLKFGLDHLKELLTMYGASVLVYGLSYLGLFLKEGVDGLIKVPQNVYDKYLIKRDLVGKAHIVDGKIYNQSPYWYYFYYIAQEYSPPQLFTAVAGSIVWIVERSFFALYWLMFLITSFLFFQALNVKASRYISFMEVALVFLSIIALKELSDLLKRKYKSRVTMYVLGSIFIAILVPRLIHISNIEPTKYNALKNFLIENTNNFTNGDRTIIYGSIRSGRWTFKEVRDDLVVIRKEFELKCEYQNFKYIVFDKTELTKSLINQPNVLYDFIERNKVDYAYKKINGMDIYTKKENSNPLPFDDCLTHLPLKNAGISNWVFSESGSSVKFCLQGSFSCV